MAARRSAGVPEGDVWIAGSGAQPAARVAAPEGVFPEHTVFTTRRIQPLANCRAVAPAIASMLGGRFMALATMGFVLLFVLTSTTLPRATTTTVDDFVIRVGPRLVLHGRPFRFSGPNIYWLVLQR